MELKDDARERHRQSYGARGYVDVAMNENNHFLPLSLPSLSLSFSLTHSLTLSLAAFSINYIYLFPPPLALCLVL